MGENPQSNCQNATKVIYVMSKILFHVNKDSQSSSKVLFYATKTIMTDMSYILCPPIQI